MYVVKEKNKATKTKFYYLEDALKFAQECSEDCIIKNDDSIVAIINKEKHENSI